MCIPSQHSVNTSAPLLQFRLSLALRLWWCQPLIDHAFSRRDKRIPGVRKASLFHITRGSGLTVRVFVTIFFLSLLRRSWRSTPLRRCSTHPTKNHSCLDLAQSLFVRLPSMIHERVILNNCWEELGVHPPPAPPMRIQTVYDYDYDYESTNEVSRSVNLAPRTRTERS